MKSWASLSLPLLHSMYLSDLDDVCGALPYFSNTLVLPPPGPLGKSFLEAPPAKPPLKPLSHELSTPPPSPVGQKPRLS